MRNIFFLVSTGSPAGVTALDAGGTRRRSPNWAHAVTQARTVARNLPAGEATPIEPDPDADAMTPGGSGHFGMIFMSGNYKRTKNDIGRIVADLEVKLVQYPGDEDLANAEDRL